MSRKVCVCADVQGYSSKRIFLLWGYGNLNIWASGTRLGPRKPRETCREKSVLEMMSEVTPQTTLFSDFVDEYLKTWASGAHLGPSKPCETCQEKSVFETVLRLPHELNCFHNCIMNTLTPGPLEPARSIANRVIRVKISMCFS